MKKLSCILLAVMLITALFVSCKAEVIDDSNLVSVHFTTDDNAKGLNWSRPAFDSSKYYWSVEAVKEDNGPKTGEGTLNVGSNLAPEEGIGPFSQGAWEFTLLGYSNSSKETLVYKGTGKGTLTKNSNSVSVPVESQMQGNGSIHISKDIVLKDKGGVSYAPTNVVVMTSDQNTEVKNAVFDTISGNTFDIEAGYYAVTIKMVDADNGITYSSNTIYVNVYAGQTTTIGGTLDESTTSTKFEAEDGTIRGNANAELPNEEGSTILTIDNFPEAGAKTLVEIPNCLGEKAALNVVAYPSSLVAKTFGFDGEESVPFAGMEFTLTVDGKEVDFFGDESKVKVTTYIRGGLNRENLKLIYNGPETTNDGKKLVHEIKSYDPSKGVLVFETNHFSQFIISSDDIVALSATGNGAYTTIAEAFGASSEGDTLILAKCSFSNEVKDEYLEKRTWNVVHHAGCGHTKRSDLFSDGYGTKVEPYLIANREQFSNVSNNYDAYAYYKIADSYNETDLSNWKPVYLHGSFDGNGASFTNVTDPLFAIVGYKHENEACKLKNFSADLNIVSSFGRALVLGIFNGGTTSFENINVSGTVIGQYHVASFYCYGTANCYPDGKGCDYTVDFKNCKSDATLIATSGACGGFIAHGYQGKDHVLTVNVDSESSYTGRMLAPQKNGKKFIIMDSGKRQITIGGFTHEDYSGDWNNYDEKKQDELKKLQPTCCTEKEGYTVGIAQGATKVVVYVNAQLTAYESDNKTKKANLSGITMVLGKTEYPTEDLKSKCLLGEVSSATIVNGAKSYGYNLENGCLTVCVPGNSNYRTGTVRLAVIQFKDKDIISCGEVDVFTIPNETTTP